jgi:hypothetical protein
MQGKPRRPGVDRTDCTNVSTALSRRGHGLTQRAGVQAFVYQAAFHEGSPPSMRVTSLRGPLIVVATVGAVVLAVTAAVFRAQTSLEVGDAACLRATALLSYSAGGGIAAMHGNSNASRRGKPEIVNTGQGSQFTARPSRVCWPRKGSGSAWTARVGGATTCSSSAYSGRSSTRRSTCTSTRASARRARGSGAISISTIAAARTRRSAA